MDEPAEDGQWLEAALEAIEQDRLSRSGSVNAVVDVTSAAHLSTDITNPTARRHDTASKLAGTAMDGVPAAKQAPAAGATEQKQAFSSRIARPSGLTSIDTTLPGPPACVGRCAVLPLAPLGFHLTPCGVHMLVLPLTVEACAARLRC